MKDYASELLNSGSTGRAVREATVPTDYASELLGPVTPIASQAVDDVLGGAVPKTPPAAPEAPSLADIPLANADAGLNDKSVADFATMVKAAMVDDPATKLRIFAKARFPNDPKAIERYGLVDGEPVYLNRDGKIYRETPTGAMGWITRNIAAPTLGKAAPIAGGMAGGAAAGGPVGMIAGAGLGAAGGEGVRKIVAGLLLDEPQTTEGNLKSMGTEALWSAGGTALGLGIAKKLEALRVARDIQKLDRTAAADITKKAAAAGVDLNVAQATNLPSAKAKYDVLASMPTSRDTIADFTNMQTTQARKAAETFFNRVSPAEGLDDAGMAAKEAATKVIEMVTKERATAARPLYEKAMQATVPSTAELQDLFARPAMQTALQRAQKLAANEGFPLQIGKDLPARTAYVAGKTQQVAAGHGTKLIETPGLLGPSGAPMTKELPAQASQFSMRGLHYMKLALDDMIEGASQTGVGPVEKRGIVLLKNKLLENMDSLSPDYAMARQVFGHFSPTVQGVKEGVISRLADLSPDSIHRAADMLFSGSVSPSSVAKSRELFVRGGLQEDWNAVLRSYLQNTFEQMGKGTMTGGGAVTQAPRWAASMTGNPRQVRILKEAMSPEQFAALQDLGEVFNAVGRTAAAGQGSQTMTRTEGANLLRQESGAGVIGQAAGLLSPQNYGSRMQNWFAEARLGDHAEKLADVMTSPDGMARLKELRQWSPKSIKFIARASSLFGISLAPPVDGAKLTPQAQDQRARTTGRW